MRFRNLLIPALLLLCASLSVVPSSWGAESVNPSLFQELRYRLIGPFRGGRTVGAVGVPTQPNVFFVGVNNGGVWKTDDAGRTWRPIFDQAPTGSVGDLAVSPSNPKVIYVGTGEGLHRPDLGVGDGIFKSTDGGGSWTHVGLGDVQQVGRLVVHPTDPNIVFVAGMGHPYGPNEERGVFRTTDGGKTWTKVLSIDQNTGANQVEFDPKEPSTVYAALWSHREGPWENGSFSGKTSGLFKSTDGGETWQRLQNGWNYSATIASTAAGESVFAFSTRPSRVPFGIEALRASIRLARPGSIGWSTTMPARSDNASAAAAIATALSDRPFAASTAARPSNASPVPRWLPTSSLACTLRTKARWAKGSFEAARAVQPISP